MLRVVNSVPFLHLIKLTLVAFCFAAIQSYLVNALKKMIDDERLIELVRKYEFLYNMKHPKWMDHIKKEHAWKNIASQVNQPAVACKQRWQCLRDSYRRAIWKQKMRAQSGETNLKKWKYDEEMSFLAPYLVKKKTLDIAGNTSDDNDEPANDCDSKYFEVGSYDTDVSDPMGQNLQPPAATFTTMMSTTDDKCNHVPQRECDELDRFFLSISDTVKMFTPYQQAMAKKKIFSLVSDMELEQLSPPF